MSCPARVTVAALIAALAAGCGDDAPSGDAGTGVDASNDAGPPMPAPALPAAPALSPCPSGWREVMSASGTVTCDPWPEGGYVRCAAADEARFPGSDGCVRVGTACPAGDFPEDLPPGGTVLYVLAGAAAGGDGSVARPFDSIRAATAVATAGTVIALGKGDYDEAVRVAAGLTLWGACVAQTVVHSSIASTASGVFDFVGRSTVVRNLRIGASPRSGALLDGSAADGTLESVIIEGAGDVSILVSRRGHLVAHDVVVRDSTDIGMDVIEGGRLEAERMLFEGVGGVGIYSTSAGSTLAMLDVAVLDVHALAPPEPTGRGIVVQGAATLTGSHIVVDRARDVGFFVSGAGSSATVDDLVVRDVGARASTGTFGRALAVQAAATATVRRGLVAGFRDIGVLADGATTWLRLEDVVVSDGLGTESGGVFGRGIAVQHGATLELERVIVERTREIGVFADGVDTALTAVDVRVSDVDVTASEPLSGFGASIQSGCSASFARVLLEQTGVTGLLVAGAGLGAEDLTVRDTRGSASGVGGDGISTALDATFDGTRILVQSARRFGIVAADTSSFRAQGLSVESTLAAACADSGACPEGDGFGIGLAAIGSASVTASSFVVDRAALCGVLVEDSAGLDLMVGRVRGAAIGACVQVPGYDVTRLATDVTYVDNGRTLDSTTLPVPSIATGLDTI